MALLPALLESRWVLAGLIGVILIANQARKYFRLCQFKGPFGSGWSELPHTNAIVTARSHSWYKEVTDRYGTIARIGPNDLITSSPELLMHMSAVRSPYTRTPWYYGAIRIQPGRDHIFSECNEEKHTKRRQQMAAGYSGKENPGLEPAIDKYIAQLISLIRKKYISTSAWSQPMDLARKAQYLALDVISDIGFGQALGDLASDSDVGSYIVATEESLSRLEFLTATGLMSIAQWPPLARLLGPSEKDHSGIGKAMGTWRRLIDDRLKMETDKRTDMLAAFVRHGLTREDLFTEAWLQIIAGSETTATTIRGTMMYIMATPRVYMKLQREIDEAVSAGLAPGIVPNNEAKELVYLQAVLREGFRLRPPVTDIVPKVVPKGGDTVVVEGKPVFLPGGTNVGYSVNGLHSRKDIFGEDADLFRPERWIVDEDGSNIDQVTAMKRITEMIFGYGKYQCLGKDIAWMEYSKAIFELLRNFDFAIARPEESLTEKNHMGIFKAKEHWVLVTERADNL